MKNKMALVMMGMAFSCLISGTAMAQEATTELPEDLTAKAYKVGMTVQDLSNATWAAQINEITDRCEEMGWTVTATQNDSDAEKTVTQIENFIASGCDFIIIQSSQAEALETSIKTAQEQGICVIGDGTAIEGAQMNYTNDNYEAGVLDGEALGNWVNETFGEDYDIKIGQFIYDDIPEVTARTDGQIEGLTNTHPKFEVVANANPTDSSSAMSETENILTAHPEIQAIFNWGDSMALGTLEAVRAMGIDESKFGIVSIDGTKEACDEIKKGSALFMSCSLGGPAEQGDDMVEMLKAYIMGTNEENYYSPNIVVDKTNVDEYLESLK